MTGNGFGLRQYLQNNSYLLKVKPKATLGNKKINIISVLMSFTPI